MTPEQTRAILAIALMAAFSDGHQDPREREHIRRLAESLGSQGGVDVMTLYQDVLLKRYTLAQAVEALGGQELRQLAFEMAVGVCEADGSQDPGEAAFLEQLSQALGLSSAAARAFVAEADALVHAPVQGAIPEAPPIATQPREDELDRMILNAAILNGALELLPQSLASMAIIPLQTRLVYRVGKAYGYELDRGHITDFLATVGVGLTSQYLEQFGRKLVGGLLGKVMGGLGRGVGSQVTGSAFSFASTYALGHVAKRYYGDGRKLDSAALKDTFTRVLGQAQGLQSQYSGEIAQRARTLDLKQLTQQLRG